MPYDQFVLLGDSITQGSTTTFAAALQNAYIRRYDVINRGLNGYNSSNAVKALPKAIPTPAQASIRFLTIWFGANDSCLKESPTNQHVSLEQFRQNLSDIISSPEIQAHKPRIILIAPPPIDERLMEGSEKLSAEGVIFRTADNTRLYAEAVREIANAHTSENIRFLDFWTILMKKAGWQEGDPVIGRKDVRKNSVFTELLLDGLHLTSQAYEILFEELMILIKCSWPNEAPELLPYALPSWQEAPTIIPDESGFDGE